ncbi:MAG: hypothetical protein UZ12_BCD005002554 [Bacteroidetes bacterium OLB12]|nr:MAG: hypothetical protein UZ12_BCD005002554 [Bacteroidetes bacterium OLB12]HNR73322.1 hypothetical protein [Cyclobacteriaceae bacterium]
MKWRLGMLLLIIFSGRGLAQDREERVSVGSGYSRHGTDDVSGFFFSVYYESELKNKTGYSISLSGTLHDGRTPILYYNEIEAEWKRGDLFFVTGGVQLSAGLTYELINLKKSNLIFELAPLLRYQSTSNPDYSLVNFYPTNYFANSNFERSFSLGAVGSLAYNIDVNKDLHVRITASLQYDTHEDALSMVGFSIGRKLIRKKSESD